MANKVILTGNVGADPIISDVNGTKVAQFSMATTERYTDKDGQKKEITDWHRIVMWRQLAELAQNYIRKGTKLYLEGKLKTRSYDDKNGNKHYVTEIVADSVEFLGGPRQETTTSVNQPVQEAHATSGDSPEDDLPF